MKTKTTIFTALLLLATVSSAVAQEKYEYATITYHTSYGELSISLNGKDFTVEKVVLPKPVNSADNFNPLLIKLNEFQDKGWEVMNIDVVSLSQNESKFAYLRRKKN